ncbi:type IV pilus biogenesis protein PilP [Hafnia paralvei]|uniref:type IV pilus biogenesis protein PilP n=1 Tax=Hafnia paralvei TaxID=546367 RepID=UPI002FDBECBE
MRLNKSLRVNMSRHILFLLIFPLLFIGNAFAEGNPTIVDPVKLEGMNVGLLEFIQGDTVITEARLLNARAQAELKKNGFVGGELPANAPAPLDSENSGDSSKMKNANQALPQVLEISGAGKNLSAKIITSNGNYLNVLTGSQIAGTDLIVKNITMTNVQVGDSENTVFNLPFSG